MTVDVWAKRRSLLLAARQLAVVRYSYDTEVIDTVQNPTTGALVLPDGGEVIGLHKKQTGGKLSNAQTINDTKSHGVGGPTRQIATERQISIGLEPQETNRFNLENWWGADFSDVEPNAAGGITMQVPDLPLNLYHRIVLVGKDDFNGAPIYLTWIGNLVNINKTDDSNLTDAEVATYPYTMNFMTDDNLEGPMIPEIFGAGWQAIQDRGVDTGFGGGS